MIKSSSRVVPATAHDDHPDFRTEIISEPRALPLHVSIGLLLRDTHAAVLYFLQPFVGFSAAAPSACLGAKLSIWSNPGAGTEIDLAIPAAIPYTLLDTGASRYPPWRRIVRIK